MKKLAIAILAVLFVAPAAMAEGWGLGVKLGGGQNDPKAMKDLHKAFGGDLDKNYGFFGLEAMYEMALDNEADLLGFKVGWDMYGDNELKQGLTKITEETYAFPFTLYYKRDNGIENISWFGGAGLTILRTEVEQGTQKESKNKVFPHIVIGGEYRFTKVFALGLEARYNFAAKAKKNGLVISDRSGFGAALTGRFYF